MTTMHKHSLASNWPKLWLLVIHINTCTLWIGNHSDQCTHRMHTVYGQLYWRNGLWTILHVSIQMTIDLITNISTLKLGNSTYKLNHMLCKSKDTVKRWLQCIVYVWIYILITLCELHKEWGIDINRPYVTYQTCWSSLEWRRCCHYILHQSRRREKLALAEEGGKSFRCDCIEVFWVEICPTTSLDVQQ